MSDNFYTFSSELKDLLYGVLIMVFFKEEIEKDCDSFSITKNVVSRLFRLSFKFILNFIVTTLISMVLVMFLLELNRTFEITHRFAIKFDLDFMGHIVKFPAVNEDMTLFLLIYVVVSAMSVVVYQSYFKYTHEKALMKSNFISKKRISGKSAAVMSMFLPMLGVFTTFLSELSTAFKFSLGKYDFDTLYFLIVYGAVFGLMVFNNILKMLKIRVINFSKLVNVETSEKIKNNKTNLKEKITFCFAKKVAVSCLNTLTIHACLSLAIVITSFGISKCSVLAFEWAPMILGQKIQLINNKGNFILLVFTAMTFFEFVYNYIVPAFKNTGNHRTTFADGIRNLKDSVFSIRFPKSMIMNFIASMATVLQVSAVNSFYSNELYNFSTVIPLFIFVFSWLISSVIMCKQFRVEPDEVLEKTTLQKTALNEIKT